jgi:hypothetical protein
MDPVQQQQQQPPAPRKKRRGVRARRGGCLACLEGFPAHSGTHALPGGCRNEPDADVLEARCQLLEPRRRAATVAQ